ncbi:MAG: hypothetical protein HQK83_12935 [Fibrobacteria bacterium]|nr:hypothetical protein [Fibrobacteria bacterium]
MRLLIMLSISLILLIGCSSSKPASGSEKGSKLELLTDFSVAVNENNFEKAISYLSLNEQARFQQRLASDGEITRKQLKALRLQKLNNNQSIRVVEGKLSGIFATLPSLQFITEQSSAPETSTQPAILQNADSTVAIENTEEKDVMPTTTEQATENEEATELEPTTTTEQATEGTEETDREPTQSEETIQADESPVQTKAIAPVEDNVEENEEIPEDETSNQEDESAETDESEAGSENDTQNFPESGSVDDPTPEADNAEDLLLEED